MNSITYQIAALRVRQIIKRAWRMGREALMSEYDRAIDLLIAAGVGVAEAARMAIAAVHAARDSIRTERTAHI